MTLNTDAVRKALIQYLQTDLNMNVSNKHIDVSVIVGRKSADKPVPDVTATVSIEDAVGSDALPQNVPSIQQEETVSPQSEQPKMAKPSTMEQLVEEFTDSVSENVELSAATDNDTVAKEVEETKEAAPKAVSSMFN